MARNAKSQAAESAAMEDVTRTAARVAAMLDRWEHEDVSDEPDWDPEEIEPIALPSVQRTRTPGTSS